MRDLKAENKELLKRYGNIWNDLHLESSMLKFLLKAMAKETFSTETYLRARQKAVYDASGFVPDELKTSSRKSKAAKTVKAEKPKKEDTRFVTFTMYKQGKSLKQIAKERDLHTRTIHSHLAHYVAKGMLPVGEFVSAENIEVISAAISEVGTLNGLAAIKKACPDEISYEDIIMVIASQENCSA